MDDVTPFLNFTLLKASFVSRVFLSQKDAVLFTVIGTYQEFLQLVTNRYWEKKPVPAPQQMS